MTLAPRIDKASPATLLGEVCNFCGYNLLASYRAGPAELAVWLSTATSTAVFVQGGQALVTHTEEASRATGHRERQVAAEPGTCAQGFHRRGQPQCALTDSMRRHSS